MRGVEIHLQEWLPPNAVDIGGAESGTVCLLGDSVFVRGELERLGRVVKC